MPWYLHLYHIAWTIALIASIWYLGWIITFALFASAAVYFSIFN